MMGVSSLVDVHKYTAKSYHPFIIHLWKATATKLNVNEHSSTVYTLTSLMCLLWPSQVQSKLLRCVCTCVSECERKKNDREVNF